MKKIFALVVSEVLKKLNKLIKKNNGIQTFKVFVLYEQ
tara:strand:- start:67 stop:180 length:114 start_codon:yes stop_codon:yes gene_type:complete